MEPATDILFNASKGETHNAKKNFCLLARKLRSSAKIKHNKKELGYNLLKGCKLLVLGDPRESFLNDELQSLRTYINEGGSALIFASEGGQQSNPGCNNMNELLKDFGICVDNSSVMRAVYHKYHHPKQALIANGIVQPEIGEEKDTPLNFDTGHVSPRPQDVIDEPTTSLSFVYPNGTTLIVQSPAITLLSSGSTSYPVDCPIAAAWEGDKVGSRPAGKLVVLGSADIFSDSWIEKEENNQLCEVILRFLLHQNVSFDPSIGRADFEERETVPCISTLANIVKSCIHNEEPLPQDCKSLLIDNQFSLKMDHVTDVIELYKQLNVRYEPLALIEPHFECPHPPLKMATHSPKMMEPSPPSLELFDLDECLLDERTRLHKLANKYQTDSELDLLVEEAGSIIIPDVYHDDEWRLNGIELSKYLLHHVANEVCERHELLRFKLF
jgi:intraflagellar transport protein 52